MDFSFLSDVCHSFKENARLSDFTTFALGGTCPCVATCTTPRQVQDVFERLREKNVSFLMIGAGSNILASDDGVDCAVVRFIDDKNDFAREGYALTVSAGMLLDDLVEHAVNEGLEGLGFASGIPGTVGGAIVGNAGAFGQQVGDVVKSVRLLRKDNTVGEVSREDLGFQYRYSYLKDSGDIVLSATFLVTPGASKEELKKQRQEILDLRKEKHPNWRELPTAGSFFRNIEKTSRADKRQAAGWFLQEAGCKDMREGGAYVFNKHANIIIAGKNTKAVDVYRLSKKMHQAVSDKFDKVLVREVRLMGAFEDNQQDKKNRIW